MIAARAHNRAMGDFLVACVNGEPADRVERLLEQVDLDRIPEAVVFHGAESAVYRALKPLAIPADLKRNLRLLNTAIVAGHLRVLSDLDWLATELDSLGVEWAVMKGPVLAEALYDKGPQRAYSDLDVLTEPTAFRDVVRSLERAGAELVDRNWPLMADTARGELSMLLPHGTPLDLHWHVFLDPEIRAAFHLPTEPMLVRRRKVDIAGRAVPTLDRTDTLLHLAAHTALSGAHRLVWLKDIDQAIRTEPPRWSEVVERARQAELDPLVRIALQRATTVVGAPVDRAAVRRLRSATGWATAVRALDALRPPHYARPGLFSGSLLVRSTRSTTTKSVLSFGRSLRVFVRHDLLQNPTHPWRTGRVGTINSAVPNPLHQPNGGPRDRTRYFDLVAAYDGW